MPNYFSEKIALAALLIAYAIVHGVSWIKEAWRPGVFLFNISCCGILLCFLIAECFFNLFPAYLPNSIVRLVPTLNPRLNAARAEFLEYLDENPFVKFRPNSLVRSLEFRGEDFDYAWMTDESGFKNPPEMKTARGQGIFAVAIGDSFVEGMGVPADSTWTAILLRGAENV